MTPPELRAKLHDMLENLLDYADRGSLKTDADQIAVVQLAAQVAIVDALVEIRRAL